MRILFAAALLASTLLSAGTVARQSLSWHDRPILGWSCPACGTRNAGDPEAAFHATCRRCHADYEWRRVVPDPDVESEVIASVEDVRSARW